MLITACKRNLRRLCFYRCLSFCPWGGGMHGCSQGGHAWLLWGGMHGCSEVCVVAPGGACMVVPRGCAWLLPGGACMVALGGNAWLLLGGVHACSGGNAWLLWGAYVVAPGACMVAPGGAMHGCSRGGMHGCSQGACVVALGGGVRGFFNEIQSMIGW